MKVRRTGQLGSVLLGIHQTRWSKSANVIIIELPAFFKTQMMKLTRQRKEKAYLGKQRQKSSCKSSNPNPSLSHSNRDNQEPINWIIKGQLASISLQKASSKEHIQSFKCLWENQRNKSQLLSQSRLFLQKTRPKERTTSSFQRSGGMRVFRVQMMCRSQLKKAKKMLLALSVRLASHHRRKKEQN